MAFSRLNVNIFLSLAIPLLLASACTTPSADAQRTDDLIQQLNASTAQNRMARKMLVALGNGVVPQLLDEVNKPFVKLQMEGTSMRAMRSIRVLRDLKSPAFLPGSKRILTKSYLRPSTKHDTALLNETLFYVYDMFEHKEARDIYIKFLTGDPRRYIRETRAVQHWAPMGIKERVEVNVVRGVHLLVKHDDKRAKNTLTVFLRRCPPNSMSKTYFHQLAENGYTLTERTYGEHISDVPDIKDE